MRDLHRSLKLLTVITSLLLISVVDAAIAAAAPKAHLPAPSQVAAVALPSAATVTFKPPANKQRIENYVVRTTQTNKLTFCKLTSCSVLNLTNNVTYTFSVAAVFTSGTGAFSAQSNPVTPSDTDTEKSSYWSGYVASGATFNTVSASWVVPRVTCSPGENSSALSWVGLNGFNSPTVEQDGTASTCIAGTPSYNAFFEMWGDASVNNGYIVPITNQVLPGDDVNASVSIEDSTWTFDIGDITQNWTFSITEPSPSTASIPNQTAEIILERPLTCPTADTSTCALSAYPAMPPVTFSNLTLSSNQVGTNLSDYHNIAITLTSGTTPISSPSPVYIPTQSFTLTQGKLAPSNVPN